MTASSLERVLYYQDWMVIEPGDTPLKEGQTLSDQEKADAEAKYGDSFKAEMGAEAIRKMLRKLDLDKLMIDLEDPPLKKRQKLYRFLSSRGFGPEEIRSAVDAVLSDSGKETFF